MRIEIVVWCVLPTRQCSSNMEKASCVARENDTATCASLGPSAECEPHIVPDRSALTCRSTDFAFAFCVVRFWHVLCVCVVCVDVGWICGVCERLSLPVFRAAAGKAFCFSAGPALSPRRLSFCSRAGTGSLPPIAASTVLTCYEAEAEARTRPWPLVCVLVCV